MDVEAADAAGADALLGLAIPGAAVPRPAAARLGGLDVADRASLLLLHAYLCKQQPRPPEWVGTLCSGRAKERTKGWSTSESASAIIKNKAGKIVLPAAAAPYAAYMAFLAVRLKNQQASAQAAATLFSTRFHDGSAFAAVKADAVKTFLEPVVSTADALARLASFRLQALTIYTADELQDVFSEPFPLFLTAESGLSIVNNCVIPSLAPVAGGERGAAEGGAAATASPHPPVTLFPRPTRAVIVPVNSWKDVVRVLCFEEKSEYVEIAPAIGDGVINFNFACCRYRAVEHDEDVTLDGGAFRIGPPSTRLRVPHGCPASLRAFVPMVSRAGLAALYISYPHNHDPRLDSRLYAMHPRVRDTACDLTQAKVTGRRAVGTLNRSLGDVLAAYGANMRRLSAGTDAALAVAPAAAGGALLVPGAALSPGAATTTMGGSITSPGRGERGRRAVKSIAGATGPLAYRASIAAMAAVSRAVLGDDLADVQDPVTLATASEALTVLSVLAAWPQAERSGRDDDENNGVEDEGDDAGGGDGGEAVVGLTDPVGAVSSVLRRLGLLARAVAARDDGDGGGEGAAQAAAAPAAMRPLLQRGGRSAAAVAAVISTALHAHGGAAPQALRYVAGMDANRFSSYKQAADLTDIDSLKREANTAGRHGDTAGSFALTTLAGLAELGLARTSVGFAGGMVDGHWSILQAKLSHDLRSSRPLLLRHAAMDATFNVVQYGALLYTLSCIDPVTSTIQPSWFAIHHQRVGVKGETTQFNEYYWETITSGEHLPDTLVMDKSQAQWHGFLDFRKKLCTAGHASLRAAALAELHALAAPFHALSRDTQTPLLDAARALLASISGEVGSGEPLSWAQLCARDAQLSAAGAAAVAVTTAAAHATTTATTAAATTALTPAVDATHVTATAHAAATATSPALPTTSPVAAGAAVARLSSSSVFSPFVSAAYGPLIPCLAFLLSSGLVTALETASTAPNYSALEKAFEPVVAFRPLIAERESSPCSRYLFQVVFPHARLCSWHAEKAVRKTLHSKCGADKAAYDALTEGFSKMLHADTPEDLMRIWGALERDYATKAPAAVAYLRDEWVCAEWLYLWPVCYRNFPRAFATASSWAESSNSSIKQHIVRGQSLTAVVDTLIGVPPGVAGHSPEMNTVPVVETRQLALRAVEEGREGRSVSDTVRHLRDQVMRLLSLHVNAYDALQEEATTRGAVLSPLCADERLPIRPVLHGYDGASSGWSGTYLVRSLSDASANDNTAAPAVDRGAQFWTVHSVFSTCTCPIGRKSCRTGISLCHHVLAAQVHAVWYAGSEHARHLAVASSTTLAQVLGPQEFAALVAKAGGGASRMLLTQDDVPVAPPRTITISPERANARAALPLLRRQLLRQLAHLESRLRSNDPDPELDEEAERVLSQLQSITDIRPVVTGPRTAGAVTVTPKGKDARRIAAETAQKPAMMIVPTPADRIPRGPLAAAMAIDAAAQARSGGSPSAQPAKRGRAATAEPLSAVLTATEHAARANMQQLGLSAREAAACTLIRSLVQRPTLDLASILTLLRDSRAVRCLCELPALEGDDDPCCTCTCCGAEFHAACVGRTAPSTSARAGAFKCEDCGGPRPVPLGTSFFTILWGLEGIEKDRRERVLLHAGSAAAGGGGAVAGAALGMIPLEQLGVSTIAARARALMERTVPDASEEEPLQFRFIRSAFVDAVTELQPEASLVPVLHRQGKSALAPATCTDAIILRPRAETAGAGADAAGAGEFTATPLEPDILPPGDTAATTSPLSPPAPAPQGLLLQAFALQSSPPDAEEVLRGWAVSPSVPTLSYSTRLNGQLDLRRATMAALLNEEALIHGDIIDAAGYLIADVAAPGVLILQQGLSSLIAINATGVAADFTRCALSSFQVNPFYSGSPASVTQWILVPYNLDANHWVLFAVHVPTATIYMLDSLRWEEPSRALLAGAKAVLRWLRACSALFGERDREWLLHFVLGARQPDTLSCALFVIAAMWRVACTGSLPCVSDLLSLPTEVAMFRRRLGSAIRGGRLPALPALVASAVLSPSILTGSSNRLKRLPMPSPSIIPPLRSVYRKGFTGLSEVQSALAVPPSELFSGGRGVTLEKILFAGVTWVPARLVPSLLLAAAVTKHELRQGWWVEDQSFSRSRRWLFGHDDWED